MRAMNKDLELINKWANQWLMTINAIKTVFMLFSTKRPNLKLLALKLGNSSLTQVFSHKHLGLILTPKLTWNEYIKSIIAKANKRLFVLKHYKYRLSRNALVIGYLTFIRPVIEYGDVLYDSCNKELSDLIDNVQLEAARTVTRAKYRSSCEALHKELGWMPLTERRQIPKLSKIYAIHNNQAPSYLCKTLKSYQTHNLYNTRHANNLNYLNFVYESTIQYSRSHILKHWLQCWFPECCTHRSSWQPKLPGSCQYVSPLFSSNLH